MNDTLNYYVYYIYYDVYSSSYILTASTCAGDFNIVMGRG